MDKKINVSGCIVTYNNKDEIYPCVKSLLTETTGVNFGLYVSDNKSTDGTLQILFKNFPEITVLNNNCNKGFGAGHNKVIPSLNSKYHVIINPDIIIKEDVISNICKYMEQNSDVGIVVPKVLHMDGTEQHLPKLSPKFKYLLGGRIPLLSKYRDEYTMKHHDLSKPTYIDFCSGCFMVVRTDLFRKIGGFDDKFFMYFEDADLTKTIQKCGYKTVFYPYAKVYHAWSRASAHKIKFFLIQVSSMIKFFKKWKKKETM